MEIAPIRIIFAGKSLASEYVNLRIGEAKTPIPIAHGIEITIIKRIAVLIFFFTNTLSLLARAAVNEGITEDERALAIVIGTLNNVKTSALYIPHDELLTSTDSPRIIIIRLNTT